jgi:iron complex outermembrane recepter protein
MNTKTCGTASQGSVLLSIAIVGALGSAAARAQTAETGRLEEVIVTAQRRSESLQNIPLSVVAFSSETLEARGISGITSLLGGQIPSVRLQPFAGNPTILEIAMRGFINPQGTDITNENPVPVYIDDVYYGRMTAMAMELADVERLEVLRGPQGTLFGKNAAGGTIRVISKEPTGELGLTQRLEVGNLNYWKSVTHLDLPEVANISAKIDFVATDRDGWIENQPGSQEDYGRLKSTAGAVTLLWKPTEDLKFNYGYDRTNLRPVMAFNQVEIANDLYNPWPVQTGLADKVPFPTFRPLDRQYISGHRLTGTWDISDSLTVRSISAYRDLDDTNFSTAQSVIALPGAFFGSSVPYASGVIPLFERTHRQFSQEFQLTGGDESLNWVTGLFYIDESGKQSQATYFGTVFPDAVTLGPPSFFPISFGDAVAIEHRRDLLLLAPSTTTSVDSTSYAAYAQGTWRPGWVDDKMSFTAGLRVGHDEKEATRSEGLIYESVPWASLPTPPPSETCPCAPRKVSDDQISPMASVAYDWTPEINTYFRYSTGYLAPNISIGSQIFEYNKSGDVDSYELGLKSDLVGGTLRLNLAAFYVEWKNKHAGIQTTSASTVEFYNIPLMKISGVELDSTWVPTENVTVDLAVSYLHGETDDGGVPDEFIDPSGAGVVTTANNVMLPEISASLAVNWDITDLGWSKLRLSSDVNYNDEYWSVPNVSIPNDSVALVNGRLSLVGIEALGGELDLILWGRNLTEEEYRNWLYEAPGITAANTFSAYGEPRTYGISATLRF